VAIIMSLQDLLRIQNHENIYIFQIFEKTVTNQKTFMKKLKSSLNVISSQALVALSSISGNVTAT